ncbi:MAG: acyl-CoA dehydrogenase [Bacteroidota bacterium]
MEPLALFAETPWGWAALGVLAVLFALGFTGAPLWLWAAAGLAALVGFGAPLWLTVVFAVLAVVFNIPAVRRALLTRPVMGLMDALGFLPTISPTEQTAIEAGTVWVEGELFSGKPDFKRIMDEAYPDLTPEEQAFLDGPAEELCRMADEWTTMQERGLSEAIWDFLKRERFLGMIVPKKYGGLGFSAIGVSEVLQKIDTRNAVAAVTVGVPNSLGPAELLIHYGTEEQRDYYLPRLADGTDIPAFALTEPNAGSDAGAISSRGTVFRGEDGELYVRLNWHKRYITLAAVSTVLGLAFKLDDPDNLLGKGTDLGISCALVPTDSEGVVLGRRHDPLGIPFYNCPTEGHDVVLPLEFAVIGGGEGAGQGWKMLMESLAAGRGVTLPAGAAGKTKLAARVAGAHARVRQQFGLPIGKFEGIEEPLARIGGATYLLDAARRYTCAGIMHGAKPAVVTAMLKYQSTELCRAGLTDAMDVVGGNGISRGPRNLLAAQMASSFIGITVEGANILTRTLMIFGQGAIRCHPYAYREIEALMAKDTKAFDAAFWPHIGHVVRNAFRATGLSATRGVFAGAPAGGPTKRYWQKLAWTSASFAFLADLAMGTLGGDLKRKEKLTGRFADIFSWMYLGATVLHRFETDGRLKEDEAFMRWAMEHAFEQIQEAFDGLYANIEVPGATWLFRGPIAAWSRFNRLGTQPSDALGHKVAQAVQVPGEHRERLLGGMFVPADKEEALGRLEHALGLAYESEGVMQKVKKAIRRKELPRKVAPKVLVEQAVEKGIITPAEAQLLQDANAARQDAIQVDSFTLDEYKQGAVMTVPAAPTSGDGATSETVFESSGGTAYGATTAPTEPAVKDL